MTWVGHGKEAIYWDDLKTPASAINPPGQPSDPGLDTTTLPGTLLFDAAGIEVVALVVQLPHAYKEGSSLEPHVHWMKTTSAAGNVKWQMRYKMMKIGEVADAGFTTLTASDAVSGTVDSNTAGQHLITSFGSISGTGLQISDMLCIELSRLGNDGADTYGADARLLEFDIHYQQDEPGSRKEFFKDHGGV